MEQIKTAEKFESLNKIQISDNSMMEISGGCVAGLISGAISVIIASIVEPLQELNALGFYAGKTVKNWFV
ncbi:hypothetical protein HCJ39_11500 [Listeria rocourtiae]|uniref:hypothetical protein n=1 Tax=Listeria rocourtiae TaxID=647910 RepID=UPI001624D54A|nr:hypothetical protein [Listeria rocourtiae]MBC1605342.1 hypothetical protein [Listeria rocourtiae]